MSHHRFVAVVALLASSSALLWGAPCRAALGEAASSIAADQSELSGELSSNMTPHYQVQEISASSGMRVREYVDARGMVFAVAWSGPAVPDLHQLLGAYYGEYTAALRKLQPLGLHRSVRVAGPSVNVELSGHMRAYSGRAYLPVLMPPGSRLEEIR
jgi:hypothetical protein